MLLLIIIQTFYLYKNYCRLKLVGDALYDENTQFNFFYFITDTRTTADAWTTDFTAFKTWYVPERIWLQVGNTST